MIEHVLLLHGLWMRGFTLSMLRRRLRAAGYAVELFDYASVVSSPDAGIERLRRRVHKVKSEQIHLIGHSLGGLIALQALRCAPGLVRGRVVCLGSPLRGSAVARGVAKLPGGAFVIGKSLPMLRDGIQRWEGAQEVGSIAGSLPSGLGVAVGPLTAPHDGTVSVAETELPGLTDHCVVAATHSGLLFSEAAAAQAIAFLRDARFSRNA
jgi:pimeloyl-ACP methyl ester carboxylesterase